MHSTALALRGAGAGLVPPQPAPEGFNLAGLRAFASVPEHCGVTTLRGAVVVYDPDHIHREGVIEGAFYVIESQRPPSSMDYARWLEEERHGASRRAQPLSPLTTSRRIVQMVRLAERPDWWWHRLPSGFHDGPLEDWSIGFNVVGKVVGLYAPDLGKKGAAQ